MKAHPLYPHLLITEDGQVYSTKSNKYLKQQTCAKGYKFFTTKIDKVNKILRVHRLVAQTYIDNPDNLPQVNHRDLDKSNNHKSNLEWMTNKQNSEHARDGGMCWMLQRDSNPRSKFSTAQLMEIRDKVIPRSRDYSIRACARQLGVDHKTLIQALASVS